MTILKTSKNIEAIRKSCNIVSQVLGTLYNAIRPGVSTIELNYMAEDICHEMGGIPAFKGYQKFPYAICASVNKEIVHGFPSTRKLKHDDIISIDFGAVLNGWYGDAAFTKAVSGEHIELIEVTERCLHEGIRVAIAGNRLGDIGHVINYHAKVNGFSTVKDFVGHGIGKELHEKPSVLNYGTKGEGLILRHGMVIAIEPMVISGSEDNKIQSNNWTVVSKDGSLSAHWEHTVAIFENRTEILTNWK